MRTKAPLMILLVTLAVLFTSATIFAAPPSKDTMTVTAQTSANGVVPTSPGGSDQWFYAYCLPSGVGVNDTLPIQFVVDDTNGNPGENYTITLMASGGWATVPSPFVISDNSVPQVQNIALAVPANTPDGNYAVNIHISSNQPNGLQSSHSNIHVQVVVGGTCNGSAPTCFFTDSSFNFLTDCNGQDVTGNTGGTFKIIGNAKGKVVSTNPGQFYYNLIWTNAGATQPVTIVLNQTGLIPQGANSVHALTFNALGFNQDYDNFEMVNQDGLPCGPYGPCTLTVNSGDVLWVTWHLSFAGIGTNISLYSNACPGNANGAITATGTLYDADINVLATCGASANGYAKK